MLTLKENWGRRLKGGILLLLAVVASVALARALLFGSASLARLESEVAGGVEDSLTTIWSWERLRRNGENGTTLWDGKAAYPSANSLFITEPQAGMAGVYAFFRALHFNEHMAFHLTLVLISCLNLAAFYFFFRTFASRTTSALTSILFSFVLLRLQPSLPHLLPQFPFPLFAYCIYRYETLRDMKYAFGAAVLAALQLYFSASLGIALLAAWACYSGYRLVVKPVRLRFAVEMGVIGIVIVVLVAPLLDVWPRASDLQMDASQLIELVSRRARSWVYPPQGSIWQLFLGKAHEGIFPGGLLLSASGVGIAMYWRRDSFWRNVSLLSVAIALLLSLGVQKALLPMASRLLPDLAMLPVEGAYLGTILFFLAVASGLMLAELEGKMPMWGRAATALGFFALFLLEHWVPLRLTVVPAHLAAVSSFLSQVEDRDPVVHLPYGREDASRLYYGLIHDHPIQNFPPVGDLSTSRVRPAREPANRDNDIPGLKKAGIRYIVLDEGGAGVLSARERSSLRRRYSDGKIIVYEIPR